MTKDKIIIKIADEHEREEIYKLRYEVYTKELHQHNENPLMILKDNIDEINTYIVVKIDGKISGFVSITPPGRNYGLDKYISRDEFPYIYDKMFEGRLFTVLKEYRGSHTALLLFFSILRFSEVNGGDKIMTIGRVDLVDFYKKTGLSDLGRVIKSGEVEFKVMYAPISDIRNKIDLYERILDRIINTVDNHLPFSLIKERNCYHGGDFFNAIGNEFDNLPNHKNIINADVLDAWFSPSPKVIEAITNYLPWIIRTSPPVNSEGLIKTISKVRNINDKCIMPGAGSSDIMFQALTKLLDKKSRVLLLNPTYGEYKFILENIISCSIDRYDLKKEKEYKPEIGDIITKLRSNNYDMFILVNPNSPTGQVLSQSEINEIIDNLPDNTKLWIDETYIEYAGYKNSMESHAAKLDNVIVCKSMSKVYALSGLRCGYLISNKNLIDKLLLFSPPWAVSLPAQIAGVNALLDNDYYQDRYEETALYKKELINNLKELDVVSIISGIINSILVDFGKDKNADTIIDLCKQKNLFIRNASNMGTNWGNNQVRITIKDRIENLKILNILKSVIT